MNTIVVASDPDLHGIRSLFIADPDPLSARGLIGSGYALNILFFIPKSNFRWSKYINRNI
jgi:hypothetical protein